MRAEEVGRDEEDEREGSDGEENVAGPEQVSQDRDRLRVNGGVFILRPAALVTDQSPLRDPELGGFAGVDRPPADLAGFEGGEMSDLAKEPQLELENREAMVVFPRESLEGLNRRRVQVRMGIILQSQPVQELGHVVPGVQARQASAVRLKPANQLGFRGQIQGGRLLADEH